jgi:hypothetical protein
MLLPTAYMKLAKTEQCNRHRETHIKQRASFAKYSSRYFLTGSRYL